MEKIKDSKSEANARAKQCPGTKTETVADASWLESRIEFHNQLFIDC